MTHKMATNTTCDKCGERINLATPQLYLKGKNYDICRRCQEKLEQWLRIK